VIHRLKANDFSIPGVAMRRIVPVFVGLFLVAVLVGCGTRSRSGAVSGKLTYKGQAVNDAALLLYPTSGAGGPITVPVTTDGSFVISDVPPGEYDIIVQGAEGEGSDASLLQNVPAEKRADMEKLMKSQPSRKATIPFPQKYKDLKTSDLKCQVTDQKQTLNLELKD
jgi:hypothetical protein